MPIATNDKTGETMFLDADGGWKPAKTAVNPETKQMLAHDGRDWVPVPAKSKGVLGYIDDAVRSIANGVTFGFADEIAAGVTTATGIGERGKPANLTDIIKGDNRSRYERNLASERARDAEIHPGIAIPGQVAGALMLPVSGLAGGATLGARAARSAAVGGAFGALSGAGEGTDIPDRAARAAVGGVAGAALGGVAAPVVEGLVRGGAAMAQPVVNAVRGAINPEGEAARRVLTAMQRDAQADPNAVSRLTPTEFNASSQRGEPVALMDMGGDLTRRLADSAAITSPEGGTALNQTINNRFEGQSGRLTDWLNRNFNFPNAHAQQAAIETEAKTVNKARYTRAFNEHDGPMWDEALAGLAQDPIMQSAIRRASLAARTEKTLDGYRPLNNPFTFEESTGRLTLAKDKNGKTIYPDLQFWDLVKRQLDANGSREGQAFAKSLRSHLDELTTNPQTGASLYKSAREGAMSYFGAENALEAGQNFVTAKLSNQAARDQLAKMTPNQRQLFQDGFVSRYMDQLNSVGDRRSVLNKIAESPEAREKLNMVLGTQKSAELETHLRIEGIMDLARGAVQGNSWTAKRLFDLGLAGGGAGVSGVGAYNMDPKEMAFGAVLAAIGSGGKHIDQRVAQRVAQLLVSNDPRSLQLGITIAARNARILDNLRGVDRRIAGASGEAVPKIGVSPQIPAVGHAEDQPGVPGPPGQ